LVYVKGRENAVINVMKNLQITVFRDNTPCSLADWHQGFRGAYCLHLQGSAEDGRSRFLLTLVHIYKNTRLEGSPEDGHNRFFRNVSHTHTHTHIYIYIYIIEFLGEEL
jgi:hypothetical protein